MKLWKIVLIVLAATVASCGIQKTPPPPLSGPWLDVSSTVKIESKEAKEKARKQKVIDDRAERKRLKELEKYKGKTKDEIKQMKRRDSIVDTNKSDQVKSLINLGLTKKEIKELKYEDDRVNKIIELTNK